jgi:hypothetical protein
MPKQHWYMQPVDPPLCMFTLVAKLAKSWMANRPFSTQWEQSPALADIGIIAIVCGIEPVVQR